MKSVRIKSRPETDKMVDNFLELKSKQIAQLTFSDAQNAPTSSHWCLRLQHDAWLELFWRAYSPKEQSLYQTHNYNPYASCLLGAVFDKCRLIEEPEHLFEYLNLSKDFMFQASNAGILTAHDTAYLQDETEFSAAILSSYCIRAVRLSPALMTVDEKNKLLEEIIEKADTYYQSLSKELERYKLQQNMPSKLTIGASAKPLKI